MKSLRVDRIRNYLSPGSLHWAPVHPAQIAMAPTPLAMQPTAYIRKSWEGRAYGETRSIEAASVHDGGMWAVRLSWEGSGPGATDFPDAIAVALPVRNAPILTLMGGEDAPIHILRWSANQQGLRSILATGIGQSAPGPELKRAAEAVADGRRWHVVIARALGTGMNVAPLMAGSTTGIGFALWRGANEERAGIKAFSIDWTELALEA
jgi:steroid C-25 hydroxylase gamma subunit